MYPSMRPLLLTHYISLCPKDGHVLLAIWGIVHAKVKDASKYFICCYTLWQSNYFIVFYILEFLEFERNSIIKNLY